jgi:hypothetical protein
VLTEHLGHEKHDRAGNESGDRLPARQARTGASRKEPRASAISARTGAPEITASTMVREVWMWPRARICRTGTPAADSASA